MKVINPATEKVIATLKEDNAKSIVTKVKMLQKGQQSWAALTLKKRVTVLQKFAKLLKQNIEENAAILSSEVGKPLQQSRNEINGCTSRIDWLCANAEKYLSDEIMTQNAGLIERIAYEPLGVVCNISAWNYPYLVGTNVFAPALLAGNSVLYKPSEYSSLSGLQIEKYLLQSGIPKEVFAIAIGGKEVGEELLKQPLNGYYFTGSYKTGQYIYEQVASRMIPCQLELGGKDPIYITDDIKDVEAVAIGTADGAFYNTGQSCCSVERIYVHEKVYDRYVAAFVKEVETWKVGAPDEAGVYIGSLTRPAQLGVLENQVSDAAKKGATLATGGNRINSKGYFFQPTVLLHVTHDMLVMREESFGPIIGIMRVKNDDQAIELMNDTEYGLTAGVYSSKEKRAKTILSKVNSGTAYWNCCDRVSAALPWSGRGHSGFGATLSHAGLRAFTKPKAYHEKG